MHQVGEYAADLIDTITQLAHITTGHRCVQVADLRVGDGGAVTVVNKADGSPNRSVTADKTVQTFMGKKMTDVTFKRF